MRNSANGSIVTGRKGTSDGPRLKKKNSLADIDACLEACRREIDALAMKDATLILISNEIGMGLHADTPAGRQFTDLQGWVNQYIAAKADQAIFMVSGIPLTLKNK